ncbi:MAG: hypothetical protein IJ404_06350 [Clostridia bacterium]|nr:hypothetical protein [Clostridia bacterium]
MDRFVTIPDDVRRYARRKRFIRYGIRILIFLALMAFAVWQVFIVGERTFERVDLIGRILGKTVILVAPFIITGIPWKLHDRSFIGIVKTPVVKTFYGHLNNTKEHNKAFNSLYLVIDTPFSKKDKRRKISTAESKYLQHLDVYRKGDVIYRLDGANYAFRFPTDEDGRRVCVICGLQGHEGWKSCNVCGYNYITGSEKEVKNKLIEYEYGEDTDSEEN